MSGIICWQALQFASESVRSDKATILAAVKEDGRALRFASQELKGDKQVVLAAVKDHGPALEWASARCRNEEEIVRTAVRQNSRALKWAAVACPKYSEIVQETVAQDGLALQWASEACRALADIVWMAVKQNSAAFKFASESCRSNDEMVKCVVETSGLALEWASEPLKKNRAIVLAAVSQDWRALTWAGEEFLEDREIILAAVRQSGQAIQKAAGACKTDREIIQMALPWDDGRALEYAPDDLLADRSFAPEYKDLFYIVKATMCSGKACYIAARPSMTREKFLQRCRSRLNYQGPVELYHGRDVVRATVPVKDWPGIGSMGEITEYALVSPEDCFSLKINTMSGKSCQMSAISRQSTTLIIKECCEYLGREFLGSEKLMHGTAVVQPDAAVPTWPGIQRNGKVSEYQLIIDWTAFAE